MKSRSLLTYALPLGAGIVIFVMLSGCSGGRSKVIEPSPLKDAVLTIPSSPEQRQVRDEISPVLDPKSVSAPITPYPDPADPLLDLNRVDRITASSYISIPDPANPGQRINVPQISWAEANVPDLNRDGLVSATDISLIASHFGHNSLVNSPDEFDQYLDTNRDGIVSAGDLTAVAFHFGEGVTGYNIYRSPDPINFPATPIASVTRSLPSSGDYKPYPFLYTDEGSDVTQTQYYRVTPFFETPSQEGPSSIVDAPVIPFANHSTLIYLEADKDSYLVNDVVTITIYAEDVPLPILGAAVRLQLSGDALTYYLNNQTRIQPPATGLWSVVDPPGDFSDDYDSVNSVITGYIVDELIIADVPTPLLRFQFGATAVGETEILLRWVGTYLESPYERISPGAISSIRIRVD